jgi:hypothetical protein
LPVYYNMDTLVADVGSRLDIGTPSASTVPTETEIYRWLNMGMLDITNKAIDDAIPTLWATAELTGGDFSLVHEEAGPSPPASAIDHYWVTTSGFPTDFLRPIDVEFWRASEDGADGVLSKDRMYKVFLLHRSMAQAWMTNALYAATVTAPIGYIWGNQLYISLGDDFFTNDKVQLHYIKEPARIGTGVEPQLPHVFQDYMVQYAVIRAKIQDGKLEEVPALTAAYEQGIQQINLQAAQSYYGLKGRWR